MEALLSELERPAEGAGERSATRPRLIGVVLPSIDLSYRVLRGSTTHPIDFRDATIQGDLNLGHAEVHFPLRLSGATIEGTLNLQSAVLFNGLDAGNITIDEDLIGIDATFGQDVVFDESSIGDAVLLRRAAFEADASLEDCAFSGVCILHGASIQGSLQFTDSEFQSPVNLEQMRVTDEASFDRVLCHRSLRATETTFERNATFGDACIAGSMQFTGASIHGTLDLTASRLADRSDFREITAETARFDNTTFEGEVRFDQADLSTFSSPSARCEADVSFRAIEVSESLTLAEIALGGACDATDATLGSVDISVRQPERKDSPTILSFVETSIESGSLSCHPDIALYDLAHASLGDVDLSTDASPDSLFACFHFNQTAFEGFDFSRYETELRECGWRLHTLVEGFSMDPLSYTDREKTYLKAKNGAELVGETRAAAEFFRHELLNRRQTHRERANATPIGLAWMTYWYRWLANLVFQISAGYGERPRATVGTTLGVIGLFTVIYALLLPVPPYDIGAWGYLLFSLAAFVTLVIGGVSPPDNPVVQFLAQFEGLLGAFLIALFVFTLTRSVHR